MTVEEIVTKVKALGLPDMSFVVFGSCPLAAAGIREAGDIDMLVSQQVFDNLSAQGWTEQNKGPRDSPLTKGEFEVHTKWEFSSYAPTLNHLLVTADIIDGVPFASLLEVLKWKQASGRPKDLRDIALIKKHLSR